MHHMKAIRTLFLVVLFLALPVLVFANHSWGGYHWARTANPFTLKTGDNLTSAWKPFLATTTSDWSQSTVLDMTVVPGQAKANCRPTAGRVEVCNKAYGNNGWLGIAQIWVNGLHITQGTTKLNDTYFVSPKYNTTAWKNLVMCQEVGHTLGLDHQDEVFDNPNLGTCMDYTNDPTTNQHPNAHDYDELASIYSHLDTTATVGQTTVSRGMSEQATSGDFDNASDWGKELRNNKKVGLYERDLGNSHKLYTFVIFAQ